MIRVHVHKGPWRRRSRDADWDESEHPRNRSGEFTKGSGSSAASAPEAAKPEAAKPKPHDYIGNHEHRQALVDRVVKALGLSPVEVRMNDIGTDHAIGTSGGRTHINLNEKFFTPEALAKYAKEWHGMAVGADRDNPNATAAAIILHEMGHVAMRQLQGQSPEGTSKSKAVQAYNKRWQAIEDLAAEYHQKQNGGDVWPVSVYAQEDSGEFAAEAFAAMMLGKVAEGGPEDKRAEALDHARQFWGKMRWDYGINNPPPKEKKQRDPNAPKPTTAASEAHKEEGKRVVRAHADNFALGTADDWQKVPDSQRETVQWYVHGQYGVINGALRGERKITPLFQSRIDQLDALFASEHATVKKPTDVYRTMKLPRDQFREIQAQLDAGENPTVDSAGYASTTLRPDLAIWKGYGIDPNLRFKFNLPTGAKAVNVGPIAGTKEDEAEVLLPRGAKFRITKMTERAVPHDPNGMREWLVEAELVQASSPARAGDRKAITLRDFGVPSRAQDAEWKEDEHKRDQGGRFSATGGGGSTTPPSGTRPSEAATSEPDHPAVSYFGPMLKKRGFEFKEINDYGDAVYEHPDGFRVTAEGPTAANKFTPEWTLRLPDGRIKIGTGSDLYDALKEANAQNALEKMTPEEKQAHVKQLALSQIKKLGYDPAKVDFRDDVEHFEVNGRQYTKGGYASFGDGVITLFTHLDPKHVEGVAAHETMHQKFNTVLEDYRAERARIEKDDRGGRNWIMKPNGELRDEYKADYPVYTALEPVLGVRPGVGNKLRQTDGVTEYSRDYWDEFENNETSLEIAIHETLAEMARQDIQGKIEAAPVWKALYRTVNKVYKDRHWGGT